MSDDFQEVDLSEGVFISASVLAEDHEGDTVILSTLPRSDLTLLLIFALLELQTGDDGETMH